MIFVEQRTGTTNAQRYVNLVHLLGGGQPTSQEVCALLFMSTVK